jgi:hypothetical protein
MKKNLWYLIIIFSPITCGVFPFFYLEHLKLDWFNIKYAFPLYILLWLYAWSYFIDREWTDL